MLVDKTGLPWLKGKMLSWAITSVCATAFLLFGYDQGVMSGVIISEHWLKQMSNPRSVIVGTIVAVYDVGAVFGSLLAAVTAERLGRKRALMCGTVLLIIGSTFMGAAMEQAMMFVGRVFTGLGVGYITSVAPVYMSECCLAGQRGWLSACLLTCLLVGLLTAYWMNYGFYFYDGALQWRFPLLFQIVPCLYILAVTVWLPDSPRWLIFHETSPDRGVLVLSKLRDRPVDDAVVQKEKEEIQYAIEVESEAEGTWMDLFRDGGYQGHKRFWLAVGAQFMQQTSGINIVSYYAPTLFQKFLGMSQERALFVGGFLQIWYLFASMLTWYLIEAVGRRRLFVSMAIGMALVLVAEAICVQHGGHAAGIGAVLFVFLFEGCFTWGWMSTSWVYPSEILPLRLRAKGTGIAAAADFLGNFVVVEITPPAFDNIGYQTFIIFAVLNIVTATVCWFFYPETAGLSLEAIDTLFIPQEGDEEVKRNRPWYRKAQWSVIEKSKIASRQARANNKRLAKGELSDLEVAQTGLMATKAQEKNIVEHSERKSDASQVAH